MQMLPTALRLILIFSACAAAEEEVETPAEEPTAAGDCVAIAQHAHMLTCSATTRVFAIAVS